MGETVDTIPSILNKCLFVSPYGLTHRLSCTPAGRALNSSDITVREFDHSTVDTAV